MTSSYRTQPRGRRGRHFSRRSYPSRSLGSSGHNKAIWYDRLAGALLAASLAALPIHPADAKVMNNLPVCTEMKSAGGVQYCDSTVGTGPSPEEGDQIVVDYTGVSLATDKIYAGSRGFSFVVGDDASLVIDGWTRGILGKDDLPPIKKGGVRTVRIPPELAFGERGDGCSFGLAENCQVPPNTPVEVTFLYKGTKF